MPSAEPARKFHRVRIRRIRAAGLLVALAAIVAFRPAWPASAPPMTLSSSKGSPALRVPRSAVPPDGVGALGAADGAVPDGTTVFDGGLPGVARLEADLLGALRRAATDAAADGVGFVVDSGWRSAAYQEHLLREAIARYGSEAAATRWVATPNTSAHVGGDAVDIGPARAAAWLSAHGAAYGLCAIYANEPWHYELRRAAAGQGCPALYADPTHDPRMRR